MYFVASTVIEGANKDCFVCSFTAIFDATLHYFANNVAYKNTRYNSANIVHFYYELYLVSHERIQG